MIVDAVQVWRGGRASYRPLGEVFDPRAHEVCETRSDALIKTFVAEHHYLRSTPPQRRRFCLYRGAELVGVAVFSVPSQYAVLEPLPPASWRRDAAVLGRLVLLDDVASNAESWFVARALDVLRREGWSGVVTFADPVPRTAVDGTVVMPGHHGNVYQALGAVYLGRARADALRLLPSGRTLDNRALSKVRARDTGWRYVVRGLVAEGAPEPDDDLDAWLDVALPSVTRRIPHAGNLKYVFPLARGVAADVGEGLPYPKLCDVGLCAGRARFHRPTCARAA